MISNCKNRGVFNFVEFGTHAHLEIIRPLLKILIQM